MLTRDIVTGLSCVPLDNGRMDVVAIAIGVVMFLALLAMIAGIEKI